MTKKSDAAKVKEVEKRSVWQSVSKEAETLAEKRLEWLELNDPANAARIRTLRRDDGSLVINELTGTVHDLDVALVPRTLDDLQNTDPLVGRKSYKLQPADQKAE
jgi:hypothetical protein